MCRVVSAFSVLALIFIAGYFLFEIKGFEFGPVSFWYGVFSGWGSVLAAYVIVSVPKPKGETE